MIGVDLTGLVAVSISACLALPRGAAFFFLRFTNPILFVPGQIRTGDGK